MVAGTPAKTAGWMNVLPDLSAAPIVSKDAQAANDGKVQLYSPLLSIVGTPLLGKHLIV